MGWLLTLLGGPEALAGRILLKLTGGLSALLVWARRNPGLALCALALLWGGYERHQHTHWRDYAHRLEAAQVPATAAQIAVNRAPAILSQVIARKSDAESPAYYAAVHRAADVHAVVVRGPVCPPRPADLPGADHTAPVDDGPTAPADMVSRPRADDALLVAAAGRAAQMHADAQALIAAGVAVPSDGNTK